jgi:iron complex transport system substrate-binding protein
LRVCSLLPSATEIVFALGLEHTLVGVTHECDYPPAAARLPAVTRSNIPNGLSSHDIDATVASTLGTTGSLYELDVPRLAQLQPDVILSQRLCEVCAVSAGRVEDAIASLPSHPEVVNLEPHSLDDILETIRTVGRLLGQDTQADSVVKGLRSRIDTVATCTRNLADRPRVLCLEWVDPPYGGGHWMPELVALAGGRDDLTRPGQPSRRIAWRDIVEFAPEVIVLTCCGFPLERCAAEAELLRQYEGFADLPAARTGRVFATDGSAYFSRPGPRIVDSLEILAHLVHPAVFPAPRLDHAFSPVLTARASTGPAGR